MQKNCPKCKEGSLLKGKQAYGCSQYTTGCDFVLPFYFLTKKISENQYNRLIDKGETIFMKGFEFQQKKVTGKIELSSDFKLHFVQKEIEQSSGGPTLTCPKCKIGTILKGKTAYGCNKYRDGCDFVFPFTRLRSIAGNRKLTKQFVIEILNGRI